MLRNSWTIFLLVKLKGEQKNLHNIAKKRKNKNILLNFIFCELLFNWEIF